MRKTTKKAIAATLFLLLTLVSIGLFSKYTPYLEILELKNFDFMMAVLRGPESPPRDAIVVAIDEPSITEFEANDITFPWPRSVHAELIETLNAAGARAIVFDVTFLGETEPEQDAALADAIETSQIPIVIGAAINVIDDPQYSMVQKLEPLEDFLEAGAEIGYVTLNPDPDGVLRHGRLFVGGEPTLSVKAIELVGEQIDFSLMPIAAFEGDDPEILINYAGGNRQIPTVSYYQAVEHEELLPPATFEGKIVFVGYSLAVTALSAETEQDHYPSPFDILGGTATMPGVEIHVNLFNTIRNQRFIRQLGVASTWALIIALSCIISVLGLAGESSLRKFVLSSLVMLAFLCLSAFAFISGELWIYTVQPVVIMATVFGLNTLYQYRLTEKERAHIRRALSGYVSHQVMDEIMKNPDQLELGGIQVEATVLFSDIAGFSKISENISPRELANLLNDYFTRMGNAIMSREGMINKYIGDAIMAIWNTPLPNPQHAVLACRSALEMKQIVEEMKPLKMRMGINTGEMVAGNLGHRERMEYTVIGDAVNLASRLEGANKAFGTCILISESTEQLARDQFLLRRVDKIRVVGKQHPVAVFEVLSHIEDEDGEPARLIESFREIIEAYDAREWAAACRLLQEHLGLFPDDPVALTYRHRCEQFLHSPPPADWDGVYTLTSK